MSVSVWAERPRSCGSTSYGSAFSPDTFPSDTLSWDTSCGTPSGGTPSRGILSSGMGPDLFPFALCKPRGSYSSCRRQRITRSCYFGPGDYTMEQCQVAERTAKRVHSNGQQSKSGLPTVPSEAAQYPYAQ